MIAPIAPKKPSLETVTSIAADGSRLVLHPADVKGRFTTWRRIVGYALIAFFVLAPWVPVNGYPMIFLDIAERRFHLFGLTLAFQDTWLLFFFVAGLAFSLFYVTAFLGRVWCGWTCPQTVYLEHVFRRIERWIDSDANARRKLAKAPLSPTKIAKRVLKHSLFIVCSAAIAHIFLSYFVSLPALWGMMSTSPLEHWSSFVFVAASTLVLYVNFAWFREHLCIIICPYGRFQSALIDDHSYNVAYDFNRGDPPGKVRDPNAGDCIDCNRCVQVCPTGIDIRQGLQLECVGCANCIDACDSIMDKVDRPRGLIRYASEQELQGGKTKLLRVRTILYTVFALIFLTVASLVFSNVDAMSATVARMPGAPFFVTETTVRNQFEVRLVNKAAGPLGYTVTAMASDGQIIDASALTGDGQLASMEEITRTFVVQVPISDYRGSFPMQLVVTGQPGEIEIVREVEFLGPEPRLLERMRSEAAAPPSP